MEIVESVLPPDRLSNLPNTVAETILTYMPLRDAVRTSILSRNWRYVWTKLPQFVLDKTLWDNVGGEKYDEPTIMKIVFQLLLCHEGPIIKFVLSNPELTSCPEIGNVIFFLSKNQIEDLTLEIWKDSYVLPYSIFSCQKLKHLKLRNCSIKNFASIRFGRLTSLELIEVIISAETLARLISGSPLLVELVVESSSSAVDICIDAPNLREITLVGLIKSINFVRVPILSSVSIKLDTLNAIVDFIGLGRNIIKFFDCLFDVKKLLLSYGVIDSFGEILRNQPSSLVHLIHLTLSNIGFNHLEELSFTLYLLKSSPNLKYFEISMLDSPNSDSEEAILLMEGGDFSDICLSELREVKLSGVRGTKPELEVIRLLLAKSPSLKKIQIQPREASVDNGFKILKEVINFRRLSNEAEIII